VCADRSGDSWSAHRCNQCGHTWRTLQTGAAVTKLAAGDVHARDDTYDSEPDDRDARRKPAVPAGDGAPDAESAGDSGCSAAAAGDALSPFDGSTAAGNATQALNGTVEASYAGHTRSHINNGSIRKQWNVGDGRVGNEQLRSEVGGDRESRVMCTGCASLGPLIWSSYSGETDVFPQSSHRRYRTGSASDRPMILALGTPQRGQMIPAGRFAMQLSSIK